MKPRAALVALLEHRAAGWLERAHEGDFDLRFASAARELGKASIHLTADDRLRLLDAGIDWSLERWAMDELGRVLLLLGAPPERFEPSFVRGDNRERQAVLKALPLVEDPEPMLPLAIEACRTNVKDVFEAIACDNPLPAVHFAEAPFNQLVLKAIFVDAPVDRIVGLGRRTNPELVRMADDYASERRAAGRAPPPGLLILERMQRDSEGASR